MGVLPAPARTRMSGNFTVQKNRLTNYKLFKSMKKDRIIALTKTAMRLTFLYVLITSVVVLTGHATEVDAQGALDKKVEVSGKRTTVKELIAALEEQSGAHFIYS